MQIERQGALLFFEIFTQFDCIIFIGGGKIKKWVIFFRNKKYQMRHWPIW